MPTYRRKILGTSLALTCDADYADYAERFFDEMTEQVSAGGKLFEKMCIQNGWSVVTLRSKGNILQVCEPDFDSDPMTAVRPDLTTTFKIYDQQAQALQLANATAGTPVRFDDTVMAALGCLEKDRLLLYHAVDPAGESGWIVQELGVPVPTNVPPETWLGAVHVWELLRLCPRILCALWLPNGYRAIFDQDGITAIGDADGQKVWEA
jgi:hypothetical protein